MLMDQNILNDAPIWLKEFLNKKSQNWIKFENFSETLLNTCNQLPKPILTGVSTVLLRV